MAKPYVPPSCVGLIDAAKAVAKQLCPKRWDENAIPAQELAVWRGLEITLNPELIEEHLRVRVSSRPIETIQRLCDFRDAQRLIRDALCTGKFTAFYFDDLARKAQIDQRWWSAPVGETALQKGTAWIDEGEPDTVVCRYLLLPKMCASEIAQLSGLSVEVKTNFNHEGIYATGLAGRPSAIHLIISEAKRRLESGEKLDSQAKFAERLSNWLATEHPGAPRALPKTIKNNPDYRALCRAHTACYDLSQSSAAARQRTPAKLVAVFS